MAGDLDNLLSDDYKPEEIPEEEEQPETEPEETPEPEGEAEPEQPEAEAPKDDGRKAPLAALHAEREKARAERERADELTRRLEALERQAQPQAEPEKAPDAWEDPDKRFAYEAERIKGEVWNQTLKQSRFYAEREFGKEEVEAAFEFFNENPHLSQPLRGEPSPFHAAVEVYRKHKTAQEIGGDPEGYKAKLREEIRREIEAEQVAKNVKSAAEAKAPSLAGQSNLGSRQGGEWAGPSSLDDILAG